MADSLYSVSTDNTYAVLGEDKMAHEFQMNKRKRNNTEQSDLQINEFICSSSDDKLNLIFQELRSIRGNQEQTNNGMLNFQENFLQIHQKLEQVVNVTNRNTDLLKTLAYKSIDQEARSRRNNLIFWGISENYEENCFSLIREFIKNHLDLDSDRMYLARAHRLGQRKIGYRNPKRPVIVNFRDFCDVESIMSRSYLLKNTQFSVGYDLPKEINEARKRLWEETKSIKSKQPRSKCQIVYPAKLIVDGRVFRDEFPQWSEAVHGSRLVDFTHIDQHDLFSEHANIHDRLQDSCQQRVSFASTQDTYTRNNGSTNSFASGVDVVNERVSTNNSVLSEAGPTQTNGKVSEECTSRSRSSSHSTEMDTELFRPFDIPKSNTQTVKAQQTSVKDKAPASEPERASRSMIRGERRSNSKSIPRALPRSQLEKPVTINSQSLIHNAAQQSGSREQDNNLGNPMSINNSSEPRQETNTNTGQ